MELTQLEKQELLLLYKQETGNPISKDTFGEGFQLTDYVAWVESKLYSILKT